MGLQTPLILSQIGSWKPEGLLDSSLQGPYPWSISKQIKWLRHMLDKTEWQPFHKINPPNYANRQFSTCNYGFCYFSLMKAFYCFGLNATDRGIQSWLAIFLIHILIDYPELASWKHLCWPVLKTSLSALTIPANAQL